VSAGTVTPMIAVENGGGTATLQVAFGEFGVSIFQSPIVSLTKFRRAATVE
jgi:hypothetical protein